jgi:CheY-like chemotaxis protein
LAWPSGAGTLFGMNAAARIEEPRFAVLLADVDADARSRLAAVAAARVEAVEVLETDDGAAAIQLGLQLSPQVAILDVGLPRLGGVEAALTLRELRPHLRIALQASDAREHRDRARLHRLPLFDKRGPDGVSGWLALQADTWLGLRRGRAPSLACAACGYGIARATAPARCPMCQSEGPWIERPRDARPRLAVL